MESRKVGKKLPFLKVCSRRAKNCTLETDTQYLIQYKEECGRRYKKVSTINISIEINIISKSLFN